MVRIFRTISGEFIIGKLVAAVNSDQRYLKGDALKPLSLLELDEFSVVNPFVIINTQTGITIVPMIAWVHPDKEPCATFTRNAVACEIASDSSQDDLIAGYTQQTSRIQLATNLPPNVVAGKF